MYASAAFQSPDYPTPNASTVGGSPTEHAPERHIALVASRADAYKHEVEELRVALAKAKLAAQHQTEEHEKAMAALTAELEARGRGEMLARARCEASEVELRGARQQLGKLREQLKRDGSERANALGAEVLDRCKFAFRSLARRGFAASVLAWRRRALHGGVARWAANARLMEAAEVESEALMIVKQASGYARAEARAADRMSAEARLRDVCDHARINRLRNYFDAEDRSDARSVLAAWRLAACAHAAETDLHEVAGRLRHAQAAIREVVDGKSQHEDQNKRQTALSKLLLGVASLHGVRRVKRDRLWSLQLGFRPWVILSLTEHLQRAELLKGDLAKSNQSITTTHMRVESLRSELSQTREKLALAQKRMRDAEGQAKAKGDSLQKAEEEKAKSEQLAKLARGKMEALEREKFSCLSTARKEKMGAVAIRREMASNAIKGFLLRRAQMRMARGLHKWLHAADAIVVKRSAMVRETQAWAAAEMEVEAAEEVMAREEAALAYEEEQSRLAHQQQLAHYEQLTRKASNRAADEEVLSPSHQQDAQIFAEIAAETGVDEDPEAMEAGEEVVGGWEPIGDLAVVPTAPHTWREPIAPPPPTASPQTSQIVVGTKQPPIPRRSTVTHSRPNPPVVHTRPEPRSRSSRGAR